MIKIVTMVGTSIFENYIEKNGDGNFKTHIDVLKERISGEYESEKGRIRKVKEELKDWFEKESDRSSISAEIKSLIKIKKELKDTFNIYLLCSDTLLSRLAGEFLKEKIPLFSELKDSDVYCKIISDLQVKDREKFRSGMVNLINEVYSISSGYWDNIAINITGGYKATIPYLTILGQVNKCHIYYIFEDTDALIEIPYIPIDINWDIFDKNMELFLSLEKEGIMELPSKISYMEEIKGLIERADNLIELNILGIMLWEKFKERYDIFFISRLVEKDLKNNNNEYRELFERALRKLKEELLSGSTDPDLHHSIKSLDMKGFECFKNKEPRVRLLYKKEVSKTIYESVKIKLYIGSVAIGNEVHNSEDEYIEKFKSNLNRKEIEDFNSYRPYKIERR